MQTPEQKAAYVNAMAACVNAKVAGMQAENASCLASGRHPLWTQSDFDALIEEYQIHHNAVLGVFGQ